MSESIAFVFPGQGSQAVGMGADVYHASPAARRIFEIADQAIGISLSDICFSGPEERLRETINTQPALVATSLALLAALQEAADPGGRDPDGQGDPPLRKPLQPSYVAGHSVGEYAALATAGALTIADTMRLVRERGRVMHEASMQVESGMAAVLGLDAATLKEVCVQATEQVRVGQSIAAGEGADAQPVHPGVDSVVVANDNAPGQIVISGARNALERAMELARERGARRVVPLAVSGAFHSPVMIPATRGLAKSVASAPLTDAAIPLIANRNALPITAASDLRAELAEQIESPVQWTGTVEYLVGQGVQTFVEVGAGQVLGGLIKRIAKGVVVISLATAADIAPVTEQLRVCLGR